MYTEQRGYVYVPFLTGCSLLCSLVFSRHMSSHVWAAVYKWTHSSDAVMNALMYIQGYLFLSSAKDTHLLMIGW